MIWKGTYPVFQPGCPRFASFAWDARAGKESAHLRIGEINFPVCRKKVADPIGCGAERVVQVIRGKEAAIDPSPAGQDGLTARAPFRGAEQEDGSAFRNLRAAAAKAFL